MARPKTKLAHGWQVSEIANMGLAPHPDHAADHLALSGPAKSFLKRNAKTVEAIRRWIATGTGTDGDLLTQSILFSFFDIILQPEDVLQPGRQTGKRLCAFLTAFPDFTLAYLATLRDAFVKHRRKPTAFNRAVAALIQQNPVRDSYGKTDVAFSRAQDKEICAAHNLSPAIYKKAKRYLASMNAPSKLPPRRKK